MMCCNVFILLLCISFAHYHHFDTQDGPDTKTSNCQSRRAASICFSAIKFASSLKNETIVPDSFRGKPLCMDQFRVCVVVCVHIICSSCPIPNACTSSSIGFVRCLSSA